MEAGPPWAGHQYPNPHGRGATIGLRLKPAPSQALRAPGCSACVGLAPSPSALGEGLLAFQAEW